MCSTERTLKKVNWIIANRWTNSIEWTSRVMRFKRTSKEDVQLDQHESLCAWQISSCAANDVLVCCNIRSFLFISHDCGWIDAGQNNSLHRCVALLLNWRETTVRFFARQRRLTLLAVLCIRSVCMSRCDHIRKTERQEEHQREIERKRFETSTDRKRQTQRASERDRERKKTIR